MIPQRWKGGKEGVRRRSSGGDSQAGSWPKLRRFEAHTVTGTRPSSLKFFLSRPQAQQAYISMLMAQHSQLAQQQAATQAQAQHAGDAGNA